MKNTIYSNRIELNNWEILGIQSFFNENFEIDFICYNDKTINAEVKEVNFGFYKTSHGEDIYITKFTDDKNTTYRLNLGSLSFYEIDDDYNNLEEYENIFNF